VNRYLCDLEANLKELGPCDIEGGRALLLSHYREGGRDALFVGWCRSKNDFLEIGYAGKEEFSIHTDVITGSFISRFFGKNIDLTIKGLDATLQIIESYFALSREDFEAYLKGQIH